MLILGLTSSLRSLGGATAVCRVCGNPAPQQITQRRRRLSIFFVPIVPLGSSYVMDCTACGAHSSIDKAEADQLLGAA